MLKNILKFVGIISGGIPFLIVLFSVTACTTNNKVKTDRYLIDEITIRNMTYSDIENVVLRSEKNNGIFACSRVISKTECSTTFRKRTYTGNWISVTWVVDGKSVSTDKIRIAVAKHVKPGAVLKGVIDIQDNQRYSAWFRQ